MAGAGTGSPPGRAAGVPAVRGEGLSLDLGRLLIPGAVATGVTEIPPQALLARGIRALIVDLDNTLSHWNDTTCAPGVAEWLRRVREAGIEVCIVSNNGPERVRRFCALMGADLPWIANAGKPGRGAYRRAQARLGVAEGQIAVVGDQVFTDILGGNRAGLLTILVPPLGRREFPATRLVRVVERLWLWRLRRRGALGRWWEPVAPGGGPSLPG